MLKTWPLRDWNQCSLTNATVDEVQQAIAWGQGGSLTTPPLDMGSGQGLARVSVTGSATPTLTGRCSAGYIDPAMPIINPADAENQFFYAQTTGGKLPTDALYGWGKTGTFTETLEPGGLHLVGTGTGWYSKFPAGIVTSGPLTVVQFSVTINPATTSTFSLWFGPGNCRYRIDFLGSAYASNQNKIYWNAGLFTSTQYIWSYGTKYDVRIQLQNANTLLSNGMYNGDVYIRPRGSWDRLDGSGYTHVGHAFQEAVAQNIIYMGSPLFSGTWDVLLESFGYYSGPNTISLTNGQAPPAGPNWRYWVITAKANAGLTESLAAATSIDPPDPVVGPIGAAVGDTGIGAVWAPVPGADGYYSDVVDATTGVQVGNCNRDDVPPHVIYSAYNGLTQGKRVLRVQSRTDDGVLSDLRANTEVIKLPADPPSVTMTMTTGELAHGASGSAAWVAVNTALTINNVVVPAVASMTTVTAASLPPPIPTPIVEVDIVPETLMPGQHGALVHNLTGDVIFVRRNQVVTDTAGATDMVLGVPGPTPPMLALAVSPKAVKEGDAIRLAVASQYATECVIDQGVGPIVLDESGAGFIDLLAPAESTIYIATATGPGGSDSWPAELIVELPGGAGPSTPPTPELVRGPSLPPGPAMTPGGDMLVHPVTAGSKALDDVRRKFAIVPQGPYADDPACPPVKYDDLVFDAVDSQDRPAAIVAAWPHPSPDRWYRNVYRDLAGMESESPAISGAPDAANWCWLTIRGWDAYPEMPVAARLPEAVLVHGVCMPKGGYRGTVGETGGIATIRLPRMTAATAMDGTTPADGLPVYIRFPDGTEQGYTLPDADAADLAEATPFPPPPVLP